MTFVTFENSLGRGFVVPDAYGGTQLSYVIRYDEEIGPQDRKPLVQKSEVVVEPDGVDRLAGREVSA
jgi:hypothetical protein